jgi:hypothetical protein
MARVAGIAPERAGVFLRLLYGAAKRLVGKVPEPMTITAHNPDILRANAGFEYFLGRAKRVPKNLKTLASIKAATLIGCPF